MASVVVMMAVPNPLTLAADNNPKLLPLLHSNPSLAATQDEHGYSLVHAAVSYNHLDLLKAVVNDFHVDVNIKDEDGETPLFVVETVEAAQLLLEELGADHKATNDDGQTAEEKILTEGENPTIAAFLRESRLHDGAKTEEAGETQQTSPTGPFNDNLHHPPPLPPNVTVNMGTMEDSSAEALGDADPEFRRRIDELAAREDFHGEEGQNQLKELIKDAVRGVNSNERERDVRRRLQ